MCHRLRDIHSRNVDDLDSWHLEWVKVKCRYSNQNAHATFYLSATAMFVLSVTVCEIFAVEICMTCDLSNVLDSNLWSWNWRSNHRFCWKLANRLTLSTCIYAQKLFVPGDTSGIRTNTQCLLPFTPFLIRKNGRCKWKHQLLAKHWRK